MISLSTSAYLWLKALHLIAVIAWMAGLFYLPRLFVYHTQVEKGSAQSELFKVMERRLMKAIMNPAMVVTVLAGGFLLAAADWSQIWLMAKVPLALLMLVFHYFCWRWKEDFAEDRNRRCEKFFRMVNEIPTLLMIAIVILAIVKPI